MPDRWPDIHIPELVGTPLIHIGGEGIFELSITNSLITMWIVMAIIVGVSWLLTRDLRLVPGRPQNLVETLVQGFADFVQATGGPAALKYLPLFGTLFLFLVFSNWLSVVPLFGQVELLRAPTSDYHVNLGLAVLAFVWYQKDAFRAHGPKYLGRFFNFSGFREGVFLGAIVFFVGIVELFAELFRMLTLTLRLWGNVLGGEIMLAVMAAVLYWVALVGGALPFIGLELFIGLIQALIFSLLVLMYFILALEKHEEHREDERAVPVHAEATKSETHKEVAHA